MKGMTQILLVQILITLITVTKIISTKTANKYKRKSRILLNATATKILVSMHLLFHAKNKRLLKINWIFVSPRNQNARNISVGIRSIKKIEDQGGA